MNFLQGKLLKIAEMSTVGTRLHSLGWRWVEPDTRQRGQAILSGVAT
jgi:hypothetical protein